MPRALITGITGQDGSYLAELLLGRGYQVAGLTRDPEAARGGWLAPIADRIELLAGDLCDGASIDAALARSRPDELYHLGAETVVHASWDDPVRVGDVTGLGAARVLDAVRRSAPGSRVLIAASSEVFGVPEHAPQSESTPIRPRSPYGAAKAYALAMARAHREHHRLFVATAILYNHESERRPLSFITRKVTDGAVRCALGLATELRLGNLEARRDWGAARDYVDAMWRMLQADAPDDYVVGSGRTHAVSELCALAFGAVGLDWRAFVVEDERFWRPAEAVPLVADASRAHRRLGWVPTTTFDDLVRRMVEHDLARWRDAAGRDPGAPSHR